MGIRSHRHGFNLLDSLGCNQCWQQMFPRNKSPGSKPGDSFCGCSQLSVEDLGITLKELQAWQAENENNILWHILMGLFSFRDGLVVSRF